MPNETPETRTGTQAVGKKKNRGPPPKWKNQLPGRLA